MAEGNCAHKAPSLFFPLRRCGCGEGQGSLRGCPVATQCLEYAIENRIDHGVWGGTSERQRRRIIPHEQQLQQNRFCCRTDRLSSRLSASRLSGRRSSIGRLRSDASPRLSANTSQRRSDQAFSVASGSISAVSSPLRFSESPFLNSF
ncbi:MAG: WhiB family transcriptional regulator [Microthrixaceae bacterium]|nr:WhiB family transcriptional regulator [Microthrixaceae bacterium]